MIEYLRHKIIRIILGKKLSRILFSQSQTNENVERSIIEMQQLLSQMNTMMENNFKDIADRMNQKTVSLKKKIQARASKDIFDNRIRDINYKIQKYAPEDKYPEILSDWFQTKNGKKLHLSNPKTFNEKIQWLGLYDLTALKTRLCDKYLVREWIKEKIGEEYLIPLLGVYNSFDEINFDELPDQFALKANHGCGWNVIVKDKKVLDMQKIKSDFAFWMSSNYAYQFGLQLQYRDIEPKIIIEQYMKNLDGDLFDYKVFCFDGKPVYIMFLSDRAVGLKMAFYDTDWNLQPFVYSYPRNDKVVPKPACLEEMLRLSEKLSKGFSHVRVDFYVLNDGTIKFGEMTFSSASGTCKWNPPEYDLILGDMITLPNNKND
jgi:hypothetical protein